MEIFFTAPLGTSKSSVQKLLKHKNFSFWGWENFLLSLTLPIFRIFFTFQRATTLELNVKRKKIWWQSYAKKKRKFFLPLCDEFNFALSLNLKWNKVWNFIDAIWWKLCFNFWRFHVLLTKKRFLLWNFFSFLFRPCDFVSLHEISTGSWWEETLKFREGFCDKEWKDLGPFEIVMAFRSIQNSIFSYAFTYTHTQNCLYIENFHDYVFVSARQFFISQILHLNSHFPPYLPYLFFLKPSRICLLMFFDFSESLEAIILQFYFTQIFRQMVARAETD